MQISETIQSIGFLTDIRESGLTYPVILATHLSCIAVFGGMILMTDMRLLGLALKNYPIADVVNGLRWWKRLGFVIMVTCGILLASSEAVKYSINPYFWTKLTLLGLIGVHALIFRPKVYNHPEELDRAPQIPGAAKWAGVLSLLLWTGVLVMGRLIGYYEPPKA
jgi:hypothetical protein